MDRAKIIDDTIQVTNINKDGKFFEKGRYLSDYSEVNVRTQTIFMSYWGNILSTFLKRIIGNLS